MSGLFDQVVNYSPPLLTAGQVNYKGTWNAATNTPGLANPPDALSKGDYYVVSAAGTQFSISFAVGDWIISNGTAWEKVDLTDAVSSVFGRTGAVVGDSSDYSAVGLTNTAIGAANPSTGAFTSLSSSSTTTLNGTTIPASKTLVVTTDKLSALAATTSAELAGVISDETGSGALVFATSPTLVTPALGTPSSGTVTNLTGTASININGTVGATTPTTGVFTGLTVNDNTTLGSSNSDTVVFNARVASDLNPSTDNTYDLGVTGHEWRNLNIDGTANIDSLVADTADINGGTIDGTAIGATTPSTVAATTGTFDAAGTADPAILVGAAGTGVNAGTITLRGGSGTGGGAFIRFSKNATAQGYIGNDSAVNGGTSNDLTLYTPNNVRVYASNTQVGTFTSTGLNSTAIGATTPSTGAFTTGNFSSYLAGAGTNPGGLGGSKYIFDWFSGNHRLFSMGSDVSTNGAWNFISQRSDGSNSVLVANMTSTGLAVTGALSATGASTIQNTLTITRSSITARTLTISLENGTADYISDATGAYPHRFFVGATKYAQIDTTGLAVTGALSSTGALAIGNTVNTVSPTSPNRTVTIVIGGTTYYLAAKTTND